MITTVAYSNDLLQRLESSLREAFHQKNVSLTRQRSKKHLTPFHSQITGAVRHVQNGEIAEQPILEILTSESNVTGFYFGLVLLFDTEGFGPFFLKHVSLTVFHDIRGLVVPFFRAEWDASDTKSPHAQPHWHFIQQLQHIEMVVRQSLRGPQEFTPSEGSLFSELYDCGRFHFAMVQLWDTKLGESCQKQVFDSDGFSRWFHSLVMYVSKQVFYVCEKKPKVFIPATVQG